MWLAFGNVPRHFRSAYGVLYLCSYSCWPNRPVVVHAQGTYCPTHPLYQGWWCQMWQPFGSVPQHCESTRGILYLGSCNCCPNWLVGVPTRGTDCPPLVSGMVVPGMAGFRECVSEFSKHSWCFSFGQAGSKCSLDQQTCSQRPHINLSSLIPVWLLRIGTRTRSII